MTPDKTLFSHPATKVASCMAVTSSLPGVSLDAPDYLLIRSRDLKYLRDFCNDGRSLRAVVRLLNTSLSLQDFLFERDRLDAMRSAAMVRGDGVAGSLRDGGAGGADFSAYPHGNHGDNKLGSPTADRNPAALSLSTPTIGQK